MSKPLKAYWFNTSNCRVELQISRHNVKHTLYVMGIYTQLFPNNTRVRYLHPFTGKEVRDVQVTVIGSKDTEENLKKLWYEPLTHL